jgi:hypothetical protein
MRALMLRKPAAFTPVKNPTDPETRQIIESSAHKAARRIVDERDGAVWVWPFEQATHADGAARLRIPYRRRPGGGDVLV